MTLLRTVLFFFASLALPLMLAAQASPDTPGTFRLLAVHSGGDGIVNSAGLKYKIDRQHPAVPISMGGNLSRPYQRPATSQIVFFEEVIPPSPPGTTTKMPVVEEPRMSVTLPPDGLPYVILVTVAPPGSPLPLIGRAFCSSAEEHPASSLRVINLSPNNAAASVDSKPYEVRPYTSQVIPLNAPESGNTKFLRFKFGWQENGDWSLIHDESFRYRPDYRMYAIIVNIRAKDEERVRIFTERPPHPAGRT